VSSTMTGEEFRSKYRLADRLTKPPVVTHRATDTSGSPVLVHFLMGSESEEGASILEALSQLEPAERQQIREVIDVDGRPTVVTEVVAGFSTFQEWLDRAIPPKAAQTERGAYTQLFKPPEIGFGTGSSEPPAPPEMPTTSEPPDILDEVPEPTGPTPPPLPPEEEGEGEGKPPGSYTMLFGGVRGPGSEDQDGPPASATQGLPSPNSPAHSEAPLPEEPTPPQPVFPTPEPSATSGSMRQEEPEESLLPWEAKEDAHPSPPKPAVQEPPSTDQSAKETPAKDAGPGSGKGGDGKPGAYTQIFGRPTPGGIPSPPPGAPGGYGAAPPPVRPPAPTVPPAHIPSSDPSPPDWQRWRDTPGAAGRHIPSDDYLQRLGAPQEVRPGSVPPSSGPAGDPGKGAPPPPPAFPGGNDIPSGPGHYTMVREGFSPDPGPSAQMAQPARSPGPQETGPKPASMPSRRSSLLTILGLVAVLLTIVALVVVFALVG